MKMNQETAYKNVLMAELRAEAILKIKDFCNNLCKPTITENDCRICPFKELKNESKTEVKK